MMVRTTYLEQRSPAEIRAAAQPGDSLDVVRVELPAPEFSRFLYATVGADWHWTDRLGWSRQDWADYLAQPMVETWVGWVRGTPAGYVELSGVSTGDVEIAYFGLLPGFLGRGLGGHLLTAGLRLAWELAGRWAEPVAVNRVWVHTCTLDGPAALGNYQARGMMIYRTEDAEVEVSSSR